MGKAKQFLTMKIRNNGFFILTAHSLAFDGFILSILLYNQAKALKISQFGLLKLCFQDDILSYYEIGGNCCEQKVNGSND